MGIDIIDEVHHTNNSAGDLSEEMKKYWDVNPPTTESSKEKHPCWGENNAGEES
jgi:hypothetical protein